MGNYGSSQLPIFCYSHQYFPFLWLLFTIFSFFVFVVIFFHLLEHQVDYLLFVSASLAFDMNVKFSKTYFLIMYRKHSAVFQINSFLVVPILKTSFLMYSVPDIFNMQCNIVLRTISYCICNDCQRVQNMCYQA